MTSSIDNWLNILNRIKAVTGMTTQASIAAALGISAQQLSDIKRAAQGRPAKGRSSRIPFGALLDWALANRIDLEWILTGQERQLPKDTPLPESISGFAPPMWDGTGQEWLILGREWLAELDCQPAELRCFRQADGHVLMPDWGVALGDLVVIDCSVHSFISDGLYVLELAHGPGLRAVLKRPGGLIIEAPLEPGGLRQAADQPILGRALGHAGSL